MSFLSLQQFPRKINKRTKSIPASAPVKEQRRCPEGRYAFHAGVFSRSVSDGRAVRVEKPAGPCRRAGQGSRCRGDSIGESESAKRRSALCTGRGRCTPICRPCGRRFHRGRGAELHHLAALYKFEGVYPFSTSQTSPLNLTSAASGFFSPNPLRRNAISSERKQHISMGIAHFQVGIAHFQVGIAHVWLGIAHV